MDEDTRQAFDLLRKAVAELKATPKILTRWEKAGIVAQFLSGVVIAVLGWYVTYSISQVQQRNSSDIAQAQIAVSRDQVAVAKRTQFTEYFKLLNTAVEPVGRKALIETLDLAVPDYTVRVAEHYAVNDPDDGVRRTAILVLGGSAQGRNVLETIAKSDRASGPDKDLASEVLGREVQNVRIRVTDVDDIAKVSVNGKPLIEVTLPNESGWVDVTSSLTSGKNNLELILINGVYGGWGIRLRVSAGKHQYDSGLLTKNECPCNAPVLRINVTIVRSPDGKIKSVEGNAPAYF